MIVLRKRIVKTSGGLSQAKKGDSDAIEVKIHTTKY